ncbi:hypothetical protein LCGC14_1640500 [marine sediment metagenome]|uniref:DeoxyPurine in DNA protein A domain-containing protein n=1 Tax=marine sediment metagenome TaxID=412755 RepID=A0A0F9HZP8_9ZZZZ
MQLTLLEEPHDRVDLRFYLGTHMSPWLHNGHARGPLFVSIRRLRSRVSPFPAATGPDAIDSGAYTELAQHGEWKTTPKQYVADIRRVVASLGMPDFVVAQDYMCDPGTLAATGLTVDEHQRRSVDNAVALRELAPEIRWLPVLQGASARDYLRHGAMYEAASVPLRDSLVGLGSIVRRQHRPEVAYLARELSEGGLRLHGFGVKVSGVGLLGRYLASCDSIAWSYWARRDGVQGAANSQNVAEAYRDVVDAVAAGRGSTVAMDRFLASMGPDCS